ncbi:MAG: RNA polymerase sigma factor [Lishizhenia sp.]
MTVKEYNQSVDLYADGIYRFVLKHLKNKMLAEDAVQETYTKVWQKYDTIEGAKVKSYLFQTAYTTLLDILKKEKRNVDIESIKENQYKTTEQNNFDLHIHLNEALDRLPDIQKSVVLLRDYEGYTYEEIGEIVSLTEAQVKVYIFRARKALKNYLKSIETLV